ncbi:hypothetical protein, partial [Mycolicibacterium elephantis]|uniref:hypothetical protein n=1 Tax=Mycolicibacterium elephantis TaxID=81858 RepID=UPI001969D495
IRPGESGRIRCMHGAGTLVDGGGGASEAAGGGGSELQCGRTTAAAIASVASRVRRRACI